LGLNSLEIWHERHGIPSRVSTSVKRLTLPHVRIFRGLSVFIYDDGHIKKGVENNFFQKLSKKRFEEKRELFILNIIFRLEEKGKVGGRGG
jgi:hypothetical protein